MISNMARSPPGYRRLLESYEEKCARRLETHEMLRRHVNVTPCRLVEKDTVMEPEERMSLSPRQQEFSRRRKLEMEEEERKRARASPRLSKSPRKAAALEDYRRRLQLNNADYTKSQLPWNNNLQGINRQQHATFALNAASTSRGFPTSGVRYEGTRTAVSRERGSQTTPETSAAWMITTRDSSQQTDRGTAVLDKEMIQLSEYLKEALHRELKLKKKLALLQELLAVLIQASEKSWQGQLNEDKLKCKVGSLEHKLHLCAQNYSKDGVRNILLDMEDHKQKYEQTAKESVQKILEDKITTEKHLQKTQRSLEVTEDECFLWKEEYEKLKGEWGELTAKHVELQNELHILQSKLQWEDSQDVQLQRFQARLQSLERERADLQSRIDVLEEDDYLKSEKLDSMRGRLRSTEDQKFAMESRINHLEKEILLVRSQPPAALLQTTVTVHKHQKSEREEQDHWAELHKMNFQLTTKEKECEELQSELDCLSDEFLSCQTKLRECRNQIKTFQARKSKGCCRSCWMPCFVLFLSIAVALYYVIILQHSFI